MRIFQKIDKFMFLSSSYSIEYVYYNETMFLDGIALLKKESFIECYKDLDAHFKVGGGGGERGGGEIEFNFCDNQYNFL